MNTASKAVVRWLLARDSDDHEEIDEFIAAIERGVLKKEADAQSTLIGILSKAFEVSRGDADQDDIERLIALHFRLEQLSQHERDIVALQEIRRILDLPPVVGQQARIRSWVMKAQLQNIVGMPAY